MSDLIPVEKSRVDFFVTGNEYIRDNLNLKFMPCAKMGGVILATDNQTLQQSFDVAKDFFAQSEPGTIKFVLIGLSPYNFSANDKEPLTACPIDKKLLANYFKLCVDNSAKPVCVVLPVNAAVKKTYDADVLKAFRATIKNVVRKYNATSVDLLDVKLTDKLFKDKARLNSEGVAAVTALLGERLYFKNIISPQEIFNASKDFFNVLSKYFAHERNFWNDDEPLPHRIFAQMVCEDFNCLSKSLPKETCMDLLVSVFSEKAYSYLACLAYFLPKDDYIELTNRIFNMTVENIRHKNKIKVGFYFWLSSHWCGDDLYSLFAQDEHFESSVFFPMDEDKESYHNEFFRDSKKYKARGLNVFELRENSFDVPTQHILFRLSPYPESLPPPFRLANLKVKETLLLYIPYTFIFALHLNSLPLYNVCWKWFFPSVIGLEEYKQKNKFNMPRGIYSGYPKMDVFFSKSLDLQFDWKMARPDAKKIIWAPHWSVRPSWGSATFRWNYRFMYEFAKVHPEISWVVKPHPQLINRVATQTEIFSSVEICEEYFKKWDALPNAKVYTGAYYQNIFATSDGMIHDSVSFIAEYQYVDKPMIYLTRKSSYGYLIDEILKASYTVDGKDLDEIVATIQRVIIEGDDYKAAERKAVFEKYLNYPKANGMLASEFIYKNIADELKPPTT